MKITSIWYVIIALLNALLNWFLYFYVFSENNLGVIIVLNFIVVALIMYLDKTRTVIQRLLFCVLYLLLAFGLPYLGFIYWLNNVFDKASFKF